MPRSREAINQQKKLKLWIYHKPKNVITTHSDPEGRTTVFETITEIDEDVISVGRLDFNTEGLLLITNAGYLAHALERCDWPRYYRARVFGEITKEKLNYLRQPFSIGSVKYKPFEIRQTEKKWLDIIIREGKNREIRKAMECIGLQVSRLMRLSFGPFSLENLAPEKIKRVRNVLDYFELS